jgi:dienelactone hydrolase
VGAGYGVLILDSSTIRGVTGDGICVDPSQLEWARRRADDAYSALDWLVETGKADPNRVYVLGRSNGATTSLIITSLIIMNKKIGSIQKNKFAAAFPMQPSCAYIKYVEYYAPVHLFLLKRTPRPIPQSVPTWLRAIARFPCKLKPGKAQLMPTKIASLPEFSR